MNQTELYELTQGMRAGQYVVIHGDDMRECILRCQSSLLFAGVPSFNEIIEKAINDLKTTTNF